MKLYVELSRKVMEHPFYEASVFRILHEAGIPIKTRDIVRMRNMFEKRVYDEGVSEDEVSWLELLRGLIKQAAD